MLCTLPRSAACPVALAPNDRAQGRREPAGGNCWPTRARCAQGALELDLGRFDGLALRVRGDGQTFKVNLKTADQANTPEETYQASFDTQPGAGRRRPP